MSHFSYSFNLASISFGTSSEAFLAQNQSNNWKLFFIYSANSSTTPLSPICLPFSHWKCEELLLFDKTYANRISSSNNCGNPLWSILHYLKPRCHQQFDKFYFFFLAFQLFIREHIVFLWLLLSFIALIFIIFFIEFHFKELRFIQKSLRGVLLLYYWHFAFKLNRL